MRKLWQILVTATSDAARAERLMDGRRRSIALDRFESYVAREDRVTNEVALAA